MIDRCPLGKDRVVCIGQLVSVGVKQAKVRIKGAVAGGFHLKREL